MGHIFKFKVKKRWQFSRLVRIGALAAVIFPAAMRVDAQSTSPVFATPHENNPGKDLQSAPAAQTFTLIGAGDIATCNHLQSAYATAKLIERIPGTVFAAGDLAYERGIAKEFKNCYDPSWGDSRTAPNPPRAIMNMRATPPPAISSIGVSRLGLPTRGSIATIWAAGTSWF